MTWLHFLLSALVVISAGAMIGRVSAELGDRLQLGRAWAGAVLLSFATTLPELVTTVTLAMRGEVGIAMGGILGSVVFNLLILTYVDLLDPEPIYHRVSLNHVGMGLLGCALLGLLIVGVATGQAGLFGPKGAGIGHVGVTSLAMLALYGMGQYALFRMARASFTPPEAGKPPGPFHAWSLGRVMATYGFLAAVIVVSAYHLGLSAEALAERYQLGATFAGATLLGIVTSLPEVTNATACARQREFDLAVGNVLGANAFVMVVLVVADFCYLPGQLFYAVGQTDALSSIAMAALGIVMQAIALGALALRSVHRLWRVGVASVLLALLYAISLVLAYHFAPQ